MNKLHSLALLFLLLGCAQKPSKSPELKPVIPVTMPKSGNEALRNGPMMGYVEMREALIWVQTQTFASVKVEYWVAGKAEQRWRTDQVHTHRHSAFTAKCILGDLEPGTRYEYRIEINGDSVHLTFPTT